MKMPEKKTIRNWETAEENKRSDMAKKKWEWGAETQNRRKRSR